jgi:hypothetical protein
MYDDIAMQEDDNGEWIRYEEYEDKVEGLLSDLDAAIEVAWNRGAHDWVRVNYPKHYTRFVHGE